MLETMKISTKKDNKSVFERIITVGDLFCGIGGWTTGFKMYNTGMDGPYKTMWAIDNWDKACNIHKLNHPKVPVHCIDISKADPSDFERVEIIVGSPPCPNFSSARQAKKKVPEKGFELIEAFFHFVEVLRPKIFVMENVPPLCSKISKENISNLPEEYNSFILDGSDFGLPQKRRRCILGNIREPTKFNNQKLTLGDIIDSLGLPGDEQPKNIMNPLHYPQFVEGIKAVKHDLYEVKEEHISRLFTKKMMKENAGFVEFPDSLDRPSRTVIAKPSPVGRETIVVMDRRFKPAKLRYLSLREQLMLQGFPADYIIETSNKGDSQVMIGNAFPPPMVKSLVFEMWRKIQQF